MTDYKKMYVVLFNAVTDAVALLERAQQETEELYIESGDSVEDDPAEASPEENKTAPEGNEASPEERETAAATRG